MKKIRLNDSGNNIDYIYVGKKSGEIIVWSRVFHVLTRNDGSDQIKHIPLYKFGKKKKEKAMNLFYLVSTQVLPRPSWQWSHHSLFVVRFHWLLFFSTPLGQFWGKTQRRKKRYKTGRRQFCGGLRFICVWCISRMFSPWRAPVALFNGVVRAPTYIVSWRTLPWLRCHQGS